MQKIDNIETIVSVLKKLTITKSKPNNVICNVNVYFISWFIKVDNSMLDRQMP